MTPIWNMVGGGMVGGGTAPGELPSDWPDIHAIVAADVQSEYAYKYIYLLADDYTYSTFTTDETHLAFKTSDGAFYTSTTTHNWNQSMDIPCDIGYKTRWVIVYSNTEALTVDLPFEALWVDMYSAKGSASGYSSKYRLRAVDGLIQSGLTSHESMFSSCYSLTRVPDILDLSASTDTSYMFSRCYSLTRVPDILDLSASLITDSMFSSCYSLTRVPDILDLSAATYTAYMFDYCYSLTRVPDVLDLSAAADTSYMFEGCDSLTRVPRMTIAQESPEYAAPDFSSCTRVNSDYKATVAQFDGGGNLIGGMVYYLGTVTITRALTLNSTIRYLFTGAEQTAIINNLTGKNWSLVW